MSSQGLHQDITRAVSAYGRVSREFPISSGVRQGHVLALTSFNIFFDAITATALARHQGCALKISFQWDTEQLESLKK